MHHYQKLSEVDYVGKNIGQGKNDYGDGGFFYGLFQTVKMKLCYTKDK